MKFWDILASADWGVRSRPARTGALVLALAAGVTAAVFVATVIAGFGREIDRLAFGAYASALVVRENVLVQDRHGPPTLADRLLLMRELDGYRDSAIWKSGRATAYHDGNQLEFAVYGVLGSFTEELDTPIVEGRLLSPEELDGYARVCLVGLELSEDLGGAEVGQLLRIGGVPCEIVGVLGEPSSRPAAQYAQSVISPLRTAERYFLVGDSRLPGEADNITILASVGTDIADLTMRADLLLRKQRGSPLSQASPFTYGNTNASMEQVKQQRSMLARLLSSLAALSLLASLIAFAAIGTAAMAARQREIALRLAIGATEDEIQQQILTENLIVGLSGGILGLIAGVTFGRLAAAAWGWPFAPDLRIAGVAVALGLSVGLGVGWILATKASRTPPSLAARR